MRVRQIVAGMIGCAVLATTAYAAPARRHPAGVNAREHRQTQRIKHGTQSGELTKGERNRLAAEQAAIRAEERVYRRSGDGITRGERRDLQKDLNQASRHIRRATHNDRTPQP